MCNHVMHIKCVNPEFALGDLASNQGSIHRSAVYRKESEIWDPCFEGQ